MKKSTNLLKKTSQLFGLVLSLSMYIFAQKPPAAVPPEEDNTMWYLILLVLVLGLAGAVYWKVKNKKETGKETENKSNDPYKNSESLSFDADEEMEWLRKNQNIVDRKRKKTPKKVNLPKTGAVLNSNGGINSHSSGAQNLMNQPVQVSLSDLDSTIPLPVFSFNKIDPSKPFNQLTVSNEDALLSAIEQTQDEYEEDEEVRDLALRILAAFKNKNSIEALSQIAIYDLSSTLRSKAIAVLTEFDHESVFETILLGCADPTREVRAAAARGLTRLSFDRTDAWTRLLETSDKGRMRQIVRAAIEGGFVERSFDRLIHRDSKHAYEAFVLLALIIKSSEVEVLIDALKNHKDPKVRAAILHVFKVTKNEEGLTYLYSLLEDKDLSPQLKEEIDKAIQEMSLVTS